MSKYLYFKKRQSGDHIDLLGFFEYDRTSVLAGQVGKRLLASADSEIALQAEADAKGLDVSVAGINWYHPMTSAQASVSPFPPPNFDPAYAGERWDDNY